MSLADNLIRWLTDLPSFLSGETVIVLLLRTTLLFVKNFCLLGTKVVSILRKVILRQHFEIKLVILMLSKKIILVVL